MPPKDIALSSFELRLRANCVANEARQGTSLLQGTVTTQYQSFGRTSTEISISKCYEEVQPDFQIKNPP